MKNSPILYIFLLQCFIFHQVSSTHANVYIPTANPITITNIGTTRTFIQTIICWAGDINNDGLDDLLIGNPNDGTIGTNAGGVYVVFGQKGGLSNVDITTLNSTQGFKITAEATGDWMGTSVAKAGDINGDGIGDIILGAPNAAANSNAKAGKAYVIFGKSSGFSDISLSSFTYSQGFTINGAAASDNTGFAVNGRCDVNHDGIDDVIVSAKSADGTYTDAGAVYVVFGKNTSTSGSFTDINLASLTTSQGIKITGEQDSEQIGYFVSCAGDFNNDNIDDIIIGAPNYDMTPNVYNDSGCAYIIFGKGGGTLANVNLASLTTSKGMRIKGSQPGDALGTSVSWAGDLNNDTIDDVIIGAISTHQFSLANAGTAYVVFGRSTGFSDLNVSNLTPSQGFSIYGRSADDTLGNSVYYAGDMNHDGIDDVVVGAYQRDTLLGSVYIVYGKSTGIADVDLSTFSSSNTNGYKITSASSEINFGQLVSYSGNINGESAHSIMIVSRISTTEASIYILASDPIFTYWDGSQETNCSSPYKIRIKSGVDTVYCDFPCTTPTDYLIWDQTCQSTCTPTVLITTYKGRNFCGYPTYPCTTSTDYLYWDGTCLSTCGQGLSPRTYRSKYFCDYPCTNSGDYLFWNGTCASPCNQGLSPTIYKTKNFCDYPCTNSGDYLYWDGTCLSTCGQGLVGQTYGGKNFCYYPCTNSGDYLYWNGTCQSNCDQGLSPTVYKTKSFCDYPCTNSGDYLYWDGTCLSTCSQGLLGQTYGGKNFCYYPCNSTGYLYWNGTCKSSCDQGLSSQVYKTKNLCEYPCTNSGDYLYWDGTCLSACSQGLSGQTYGGKNFCYYPCTNSGDYLYWNGTCKSSCDQGLSSHRL